MECISSLDKVVNFFSSLVVFVLVCLRLMEPFLVEDVDLSYQDFTIEPTS